MINKRIIQNIKGGGVFNQVEEPKPSVTVVLETANEVQVQYSLENNTYSDWRIQYSPNPNFTDPTTVISDLDTFTIIAQENPLTQFYFQVQGYTDVNNFGNWSSSVLIDPSQPVEISDMSPFSYEGDTQASIEYSDLRNAQGVGSFEVQYKESSAQEWTVFNTYDPEIQQGADVTVTGLTNDVQYDIRIWAIQLNFNWTSRFSSITTVTPKDVPEPKLSTPTGLVFIQETNTTGGFSFNAVQNANQYTVRLNGSVIYTGVFSTVNVTGIISEPPTEYEINVVAQDTSGTFLDSNIASLDIQTRDVESDNDYTPEAYGAEAWMKPLDGRLEFGLQFPYLSTVTPYSQDPTMLDGTGLIGTDYSRITSNTPNTFNSNDIGKKFAALFIHNNPPFPDYSAVDAYFPPNIQSTRYSDVVYIIDSQNAIVNFEYNGGDRENPQTSVNAKGYLFIDNSDSINNAWDAYMVDTVQNFKFRPCVYEGGFVISCYVAPQLNTINGGSKNVRIWSGSDIHARVKRGVEDYYGFENNLGTTVYNHTKDWFYVDGDSSADFVVHNIDMIWTHRQIPTVSTGRACGRILTGGLRRVGLCAFYNMDTNVEFKAIESGSLGLTLEHFTLEASGLGRGGTNTTNGVLTENSNLLIEYFNVERLKGAQSYGQFTANDTGGGTYIIFDGGQSSYVGSTDTPAQMSTSGKLTTDYTGLPVTPNGTYSHAVEIDGKDGNFYIPMFMGGSNRHGVITFEVGSNEVVVLMQSMTRYNDMLNIWESMYRKPTDPLNNWGRTSESADPNWGFVGSKSMLTQIIPEVGQTYTVSRDYNSDATSSNQDGTLASYPQEQNWYSNRIRTSACWTTIVQKRTPDLDLENDIPLNGKPIALQAGDQFTIPSHTDPNEVFTVVGLERGVYGDGFSYELVTGSGGKPAPYYISRPASYRWFSMVTDKTLPNSLGLTFEITMVTSRSEVLLDGQVRNFKAAYCGNVRWDATGNPNWSNNRVTTDTTFSGRNYGDPELQIAYIHGEVSKQFINHECESANYWRENNNGSINSKAYTLRDGTQVGNLALYNKNIIMQNCIGLNRFGSSTSDIMFTTSITKGMEEVRKIVTGNNPDYDFLYGEITDVTSNTITTSKSCLNIQVGDTVESDGNETTVTSVTSNTVFEVANATGFANGNNVYWVKLSDIDTPAVFTAQEIPYPPKVRLHNTPDRPPLEALLNPTDNLIDEPDDTNAPPLPVIVRTTLAQIESEI